MYLTNSKRAVRRSRTLRTSRTPSGPRGQDHALVIAQAVEVLSSSSSGYSVALGSLAPNPIAAPPGDQSLARRSQVCDQPFDPRGDPYLSTWLTRGSPANGRNSSKNSIAAGV